MDKSTDGVPFLHNLYQRYRLACEAPLDYEAWLEDFAIALSHKLDESLDIIESAEEDRDRYKHAAQATHDAWCELTEKHNRLHGFIDALRHQMQSGNMAEVLRLVLHYCCWN